MSSFSGPFVGDSPFSTFLALILGGPKHCGYPSSSLRLALTALLHTKDKSYLGRPSVLAQHPAPYRMKMPNLHALACGPSIASDSKVSKNNSWGR